MSETSTIFKTLELVLTIQTLTNQIKNGVTPFSKVDNNEEFDKYIIYDDKTLIREEKDIDGKKRTYPLVESYCTLPDHHDIISLFPYKQDMDEITFELTILSDKDFWINIIFANKNDPDDPYVITIYDDGTYEMVE